MTNDKIFLAQYQTVDRDAVGSLRAYYVVTKTINTLAVEIGQRLEKDEVEALIIAGKDVTISGAKK